MFGDEAQEIHVRTKNFDDRWSHDYVFPIKKRTFDLQDIAEGEYFFDMDPGLGNATSFSFPADIDVQNLELIVMADNLGDGLHDFYVRTKDEAQQWSLTNISVDILMDQALPVHWLDFQLIKRASEIDLLWSVQQAFNSSHYNIEKKQDSEFVKIGQVTSENTEEVRQYSFTDHSPQNGWNYYRLQQVDRDGTMDYSEIRSAFYSKEIDISLYPNPTQDLLYISGLDQDAPCNYRLYDQNKRLLKAGDLAENTSIQLKEFSQGAYFLILEVGEDSQSFMIIKQ